MHVMTVSHSIVALSGTKLLQPMALALLIYTVSLRLAGNTCFIQVCTLFSQFLTLHGLTFPSGPSYSLEVPPRNAPAWYLLYCQR